MKKKHLMPYALQFFAEGEDNQDTNDGSAGEDSGSEGSDGDGDQSQEGGNKSGERTFTQSEMTAIGTREKNQGKNSILKLFGCKDEKAAKAEAEEFKKWKESQLTDSEKKDKAIKQLQDSTAESEARAVAAENKLSAIQAGVNRDSVDDALAIALLKVTDDKDLDTVFEEMKKEPRYSGFFEKGSSTGGTGSSADHKGGNNGGKENIGKRLAESRNVKSQTKSSFFTN